MIQTRQWVMATIFLDKPEDGQADTEAIDHEYDDYKENAEKLHKAKLQEIEEGFCAICRRATPKIAASRTTTCSSA